MTIEQLKNISSYRNPGFVAFSVAVILILLLLMFTLDEYVFQSRTITVDPSKNISEYKLTTEKYYEAYRQWTIEENYKVFDWHLRSTKIIFWVSMLVGVSGIAFALWQFVEAAKEERQALEVDELELKTQLVSLAFKSRSIAALVMFMSVAYLLIYVILVYPIRYTPQQMGTAVERPASAEAITKKDLESAK